MFNNAISEPLVTIAIPTYNRHSKLLKALESCRKQTYPNLEILICDNSTDSKTKDLVKQFKKKYPFFSTNITYKKNLTNLGMGKNWKQCIEIAQGDYILILSDDDLLNENAIKNLIFPFKNKKGISLSIGCAQITNISGSKTKNIYEDSIFSGEKYIENVLRGKNIYYASATLMPKETALLLGGFDIKKYQHAFDVALSNKLAMHGNVSLTKEIVVEYFEHQDGSTHNLPFVKIINDTKNLNNEMLNLFSKNESYSNLKPLSNKFILRRTSSLISKYGTFQKRINIFKIYHYVKDLEGLFIISYMTIYCLLPNAIRRQIKNMQLLSKIKKMVFNR